MNKATRRITTVEQDSGLWFVYERNGVGEPIHIGSVFDKGNKVAGIANGGYQVVNWDGSSAPEVYGERKSFWAAVKLARELARLSCNY